MCECSFSGSLAAAFSFGVASLPAIGFPLPSTCTLPHVADHGVNGFRENPIRWHCLTVRLMFDVIPFLPFPF